MSQDVSRDLRSPDPPRRAAAALVAVLACALAACGADRRQLRPGSYRAVLEVPGGELPFGLDIGQESGRYVLVLLNGEERQRIEDVRFADGTLSAVLPDSAGSLDARTTRHGLEGELRLIPRGGPAMSLPFRAEFGAVHRFVAEPLTDNADVQARWSMTLTAADGAPVPAVAVFSQHFAGVTGRIETRAGAGPLLAGEIRDDELFLSRFDGRTAVLLHAKIDADGALGGEVWSATDGAAHLRAVRDPDAVL
jgi:hypothetical protein